MKTESHLLIFSLFAVFFVCSVSAGAESLTRPDAIRPSPKLAGVDTLWIDVKLDGSVDSRSVLPTKIRNQCSEKLQRAGVVVTSDPNLTLWSTRSKIPVLKIRIDVLDVNDTLTCIFHARTSFSRMVSLDMESGPILYKADVWESKSVMECAIKEKLQEILTDAVLKQVDYFVADWSATKASGADSAAGRPDKATAERQSEPSEKQNVEQKFVASKNGDVFHKPDCPFAQNIASKNLISYGSKEEAIAAGKRPCKKCNP